ncbi:hypothetical protein GCM10017559_78230 [Streptosporangium longisporum]|uniref:Uncharacterized protein n=1 Tax=Streptosporangium longisporum TaxID=46187 RepID=A0ABP6LGG1_9ACTN
MWAAVGFSVLGSTSQKTGLAPREATALPAPTKLIVGMTTSEPGPAPASSIAMNVASVHELVEVTCRGPTPR